MERSRQHLKRKFWDTPKPLFNPWRRVLRPCRPQYGIHFEKANHFGKFDEFVEHNMYLDCKTKRAALVASPFVVCLTSYTGAQRLFICSGTVVHSYGVDGEYFSTVLTSATLIRCPKKEDAIADDIKVDVRLFDHSLCEGEILGYDFHYNVAAIRIKSDVRLQTAVIGNLDDYTECLVHSGHSPPFQLVPHRDTTTSSELIKLCPGMAVIALGRYNDDPYHIMAAPGKLILKDCGLDCGELVMANSEITKNGIGGPLINYSGCVIGLNFYRAAYTPFLPINIALKCLEHLLKYREVPQPWLGLEISDLDTTELGDLEKLIQSSPNTLSGVFVRKVESRSPASDAGISPDDIIIQIDGIHVESSLKFTSVLLDKAKEPFELVVKRAGSSTPLTLPVLPLSSRKLNRWPLPEEFNLRKPCLTMRSVP